MKFLNLAFRPIAMAMMLAGSISMLALPQENLADFVEIENGRELYTRVFESQESNAPILFVLNGMTYNTEVWNQMLEGIVGQGYTVVVYDPEGMGKTLEKFGPQETRIPIENQVDDLLEENEVG